MLRATPEAPRRRALRASSPRRERGRSWPEFRFRRAEDAALAGVPRSSGQLRFGIELQGGERGLSLPAHRKRQFLVVLHRTRLNPEPLNRPAKLTQRPQRSTLRNRIERFFNRAKNSRRVATATTS